MSQTRASRPIPPCSAKLQPASGNLQYPAWQTLMSTAVRAARSPPLHPAAPSWLSPPAGPPRPAPRLLPQRTRAVPPPARPCLPAAPAAMPRCSCACLAPGPSLADIYEGVDPQSILGPTGAERELVNKQGLRLKAYYLPAASPRAVLLFVHGGWAGRVGSGAMHVKLCMQAQHQAHLLSFHTHCGCAHRAHQLVAYHPAELSRRSLSLTCVLPAGHGDHFLFELLRVSVSASWQLPSPAAGLLLRSWCGASCRGFWALS